MPKLTKTIVDGLEPMSRDYMAWDSEVHGFGVRVWPSGQLTYLLKYRVGGGRSGRIRKPTIGTHGKITVDEARAVARRWLADVIRGGDPSAARKDYRQAPTMAELADRYMSEHAIPKKKPRSVYEDRRLLARHILPRLGTRKVLEITRETVANLHRDLASHPYDANHCVALLSKMMNLAEMWGLRSDGANPCRHIERYKERRRERFLSTDELTRLAGILADVEREGREQPSVVPALRLLLFTGARLMEVLTLRWEYVDFENRCARLPDSKTGAKTVMLPAPALDVLAKLARDPSGWVLPGSRPGIRLVNLQQAWTRIRKRASLPAVRMHDFRHTFASIAAGQGEGLLIIGKMLGHTQAATTQRYAHLVAAPVQRASDRVAATLAAIMDGKPGEVVPLRNAS